MNSFRFTTIKIVLGYSLLLVFLLFGLLFIRREMRILSQSGQQQESVADSLLHLLAEKDRSILQMVQLMNKANEQALSMTEIERIISEQDSVFAQQRVQRSVVMKQDTVLASPPKKGFLKRVAEVFAPSKNDTTILLNTSYEVSIDSVIEAVNPADSLHQRLLKANEESRKTQQLLARRNSARFRKINQQLSARMDSLMKDFEQNMMAQTDAMAQREHQVRKRSSKVLGGIAIAALLLSVIFVIIIWRDLSQSNRYRKRLEEANERTAQLLVAREKLMLAITHDIKAPLSSVLGYVELLRQSVSSEKERTYLTNMEASSQHLLKLITDLLDFHRLDLNKMEINRESFNPYRLFEELTESFVPLVDAKHLDFNADIAPELNQLYISDPLRIRQIVTNLLSNAIKFTAQGSVSLRVNYSNSVLYIYVADTGAGISNEQKELIFREFTRLPQAQGQEGVGLGLSIVHKLVRLLEGEITVESEVGQGTEFAVRLPLYLLQHTKEDAPFEMPATTDVVTVNSASGLNVLMIDDDEMQLALTREMLQHQGMSVTCCNQVDDLLNQLRTNQFDLLLTDIQMPAMSGFDLLRLLRASNVGQSRQIPVIAVTARSDMSLSEFLEAGFAGCLHKPFTMKELLSTLHDSHFTLNAPLVEEFATPSQSEVYNFDALLIYTDGDVELGHSILSTFIDETNKDLHFLDEALQKGDVRAIAAKSHKLLPIFTMLGHSEAISLLAELENSKDPSSLNDGYLERVRLLITALQNSLKMAHSYQKNLQ